MRLPGSERILPLGTMLTCEDDYDECEADVVLEEVIRLGTQDLPPEDADERHRPIAAKPEAGSLLERPVLNLTT